MRCERRVAAMTAARSTRSLGPPGRRHARQRGTARRLAAKLGQARTSAQKNQRRATRLAVLIGGVLGRGAGFGDGIFACPFRFSPPAMETLAETERARAVAATR
jgi:hypothetical protein